MAAFLLALRAAKFEPRRGLWRPQAGTDEAQPRSRSDAAERHQSPWGRQFCAPPVSPAACGGFVFARAEGDKRLQSVAFAPPAKPPKLGNQARLRPGTLGEGQNQVTTASERLIPVIRTPVWAHFPGSRQSGSVAGSRLLVGRVVWAERGHSEELPKRPRDRGRGRGGGGLQRVERERAWSDSSRARSDSSFVQKTSSRLL